MCSAVRRRMLSKGIVSSPEEGFVGAAASLGAIGAVSSGAGTGGATGAVLAAGGGVAAGRAAGVGAVGAGALGAGAAGAAPCRRETASRTSLRVMRPPSPLPCTSPASRPYSLSRRRTTGDMSCPPAAAWGGAPEVVVGAPEVVGGAPEVVGGASEAVAAGSRGGDAGCGVGVEGAGRAGCDGASGCGGAGAAACVGCGGAAEVAVVAPAPSEITARRVPTSAVSPSWTRISLSVPDAGAGTSESTLSVETSKSGSSASTWSPTLFSQRVIVPSVTVSPSCGIWMSTRGPPSSGVQAATGERERGLAEQLTQRRVGMDERPDLGRARLPVDREVALLQQLGRPRSGDVHAENRPVAFGDDLHEPVGLADDERPAVPAEALHLRHDVEAELACVLLGVPGERDLGMAVDAPRDLLVVDRGRLLTEDRLDCDDRLGEADVRELRGVD